MTSAEPEFQAGVSTPTANGDEAATPNKRRIVKATAPKASENDAATATGSPTTNGNGNHEKSTTSASSTPKNKRSLSPKRGGGHNNKHDDDDDETTGWRKERLKTTEKRGKALREKDLAERRKTNAAKSEASANATANPFSRFLSAFSVDPEFPEHKRSLEESTDEQPPSGKRLKASAEDGDAENEYEYDAPATKEKGISSTVWIAATVVAVAAVGVAMALQRRKK